MTISSHKILITGASGQLGYALQTHAQANSHTLIPLSHQDLDITDAKAVHAAIAKHQPTLVINSAAYTAVDKAESEIERCFAINRDGAHNLATACQQASIPLIHISTDYVFDGNASTPYKEHDTTTPLNVYGESKLAGEAAVRMACDQHIILRVSGIHSLHGHNFLNTIIRFANERSELNMVGDQTICPTSAGDIAGAIYSICQQLPHGGLSDTANWGTYHYCSSPATSWHDFTVAILDEIKKKHIITLEKVNRITTDQYKTPAARPAYSVLDCTKIKNDYAIDQPDWRTSLASILKE